MKTRKNLNNFLVMSVFLLATLCTAAAGETRYVPSVYITIQEAINAAVSGVDQIEVAPGTYNEAINFNGKAIRLYSSDGPQVTTIDATGLNASVVTCDSDEGPGTILEGFTITGGNADWFGGGMNNFNGSPTVLNCTFSGNSATRGAGMGNREESSPTLSNCTFSGNSATRGGAMANWDFSSPTLTNCTFSGNSAWSGGGICNSRSSPTLVNCTFSGNSAGEGGAGMDNWNSSPMLTNCTFSGNSGQFGGGVHNLGSSPTLTNCTFTGNSATRGAGMYSRGDSNPMLTECEFAENVASNEGGGMYNENAGSCPMLKDCTFSGNSAWSGGGMCNAWGASPTVTNCTFSENRSDEVGGGMYNSWGSNPMLTNCTFAGNSANGDYQGGGGMWNGSSSPTLTNCTFSANSAAYNGGGMVNSSSSPTVTNCTFSGNSANGTATYYDGGGGMWNLDGSPKVTNCTFRANSALNNGGGMSNLNNSSPTVTNCTFRANSAVNNGGGMWNRDSSPTLTNSILWGDTARTGPEIHNDGTSSPTVTYCDVQGGCSGTGNIALDPMFADADMRLSAGSPCIDAGDNDAVPAGVETDLDGNPRIFNGIVDMGAYESEEEGPSIITVEIDIKPGGYPNAINLASHGLVPVAILSNGEFEAIMVDPETVEFAGAGVAMRGKSNKYMGHEEDVNGDQLSDLVLQFATQEIDPNRLQDGYAVLTGITYDGQAIEGQDEIIIVPPEE